MADRQLPHNIKPYSLRFRDWIMNRTTLGTFIDYFILHKGTPQYLTPKTITSHFKQSFKYGLTSLFPFDGYDPITQQIIYHNNKKGPVYTNHAFGWLTLLAFFGLPTRPHAVEAEDGTLNPQLTAKDVIINLFGGWKSPAKNLSRRQAILQWIAVFTVKPFVIFPLNVITGIFKLVQNIIKLAIFVPFKIIDVIISHISYALLTSTYKTATSSLRLVPKVFATAILGTLSLISLAGIPLLIANRILKAIINPLHSIRSSFNIGRQLDTWGVNQNKKNNNAKKTPNRIADIIGYASGAGSLIITIIAWTILLPLIVGAVLTAFPALVPAVIATLGWIAHVPFIAGAFGVAQGAFATLGTTALATTLSSLFAPIITSLSAFFGLQISANLLASLATVGFIAAPAGVALTYAANKFSDWYASWYGPAEKLASDEIPLVNTSNADSEDDRQNEHDFDTEISPSPDVQQKAEKLLRAKEEAEKIEDATTATGNSASAPTSPSAPKKLPQPGAVDETPGAEPSSSDLSKK